MNIAIVAPNLSGKGGTEAVLDYVMNSLLINKGNELTLKLLDECPDTQWINMYRNRVLLAKYNNKVLRLIDLIIFFIKSEHNAIVALGPRLIFIAKMVKIIFRKRYTVLSWVHFSLEDVETMNPKYLPWADGHLSLSTVMDKQLIDLGIPSNKIETIYNPVNFVTAADRQQLVENNIDKLTLAYVGRVSMNEPKNLKFLVDVVVMLNQKYKNLVIHIIGDGIEAESVREYAKAKQVERLFIWHGWQTNPWDELRGIDVDALVFTSQYEGFGLVVAEALSRNIPVISTDSRGGVHDLIQSGVNGEIVKQMNVEKFTQAVLRIKSLGTQQKNNIWETINWLYGEKYDSRMLDALKRFSSES